MKPHIEAALKRASKQLAQAHVRISNAEEDLASATSELFVYVAAADIADHCAEADHISAVIHALERANLDD